MKPASRRSDSRTSGDQLILVRHANPAIDPALPAAQWRLSARGRERCILLAERLASFGLQAIITSEELKAEETGRLVAGHLGLQVSAHPGLQEQDRRGVGFLSPEDFQKAVLNVFRHPEARIFGNESAREAQIRFRDALSAALAGHPAGNLAVVSHGTVIALFAALYNSQPAEEIWTQLTRSMPSFLVLSRVDYRLLGVETVGE